MWWCKKNIQFIHRVKSSKVEDETWQVLKEMVKADKDSVYKMVISPENADVEVLFVQTSSMRRILDTYPKILFLDEHTV